MKKFQIPGKTKSQKLKNLDIVLGRMVRRMNRKTIVAIPPVIITQSIRIPTDGVVFAAPVPITGTIGKLCFMGEHSLDEISYSLDVSITSIDGARSRTFNASNAIFMGDVNEQLIDFSLVKVIVNPIDIMSNIHTSISIYPDRSSIKQDFFIEPKDNHEYLLEDLSDAET